MVSWDAIEDLKRESTLQVLFKVARILNERAVERVRAKQFGSRFRTSHTALFPHIPRDGIRLTELARKLGISKQAVFQLVVDLEQMGVLLRVPDPADGRCKLIGFSDSGQAAIADGLRTLVQLEAELGRDVGEATLARFRQALLEVHDVLINSAKK